MKLDKEGVIKKVFLGVVSIFLGLSLCGCAAVLIGAGVAGGVAISEDTARLEKDTSFGRAWAVTYKTIEEMGAINLQDKNAGRIEANIRDSKATAQITQITPKTVRIEIKARGKLFPKIDLAMEIINEINSKL